MGNRGEETIRTGTTASLVYTLTALGAATVIVAALLALGYAVPVVPNDRWAEVFAVGLLLIAGPYGFYSMRLRSQRKRIDAQMPDLLRDLATMHESGLTIPAAIRAAARGEYGDLNPEIRRMAAQLEFNVPLDEVLERFAGRADTPLVERSVSLLRDAIRSGGRTVDAIRASSRDAAEFQELDDARTSTMSLYSAVVYVSFLVFLLIAAVLANVFLPTALEANLMEAASVGGATVDSSAAAGATARFRSLFLFALVMTGLGNGLVVGMLQSGRPLAGLHHSFLMVTIAFVAVLAAG